MTVGHFGLRVKVFSRQKGHCAVLKAAYRSASKLYDQRYDRVHNYSHKNGVVHTEVLAPEGSPDWACDRERLWNEVERVERYVTARLAREAQFDMPNELSMRAQVELARSFLREQFVARGMVADFALHHDKPHHPHVHCMLTTRDIGPDGFGGKRRDWDDRQLLKDLRVAWQDAANWMLLREGHATRIDHRSYAARGIELEPQPKLYLGAHDAANDRRAPLRDQAQRRDAVRARNCAAIIANPRIALTLLTEHQSTFTESDIDYVLKKQTASQAQLAHAWDAVLASPDLVHLDDFDGQRRYTATWVVKGERQLFEQVHLLGQRSGHQIADDSIEQAIALSPVTLSDEQKDALRHIVTGSDFAIVEGRSGTGKSTTLGAARAACEAEGLIVVGSAVSSIAAEQLQTGLAAIPSRTLHSWTYNWKVNRERLTPRHVFVIDEAGMVGTDLLAEVASEVRAAGAKLVLVGDTHQLRPIDRGTPMRVLEERYGAAALSNIVRQRVEWQRDLSLAFAKDQTAEALASYAAQKRVRGCATQELAVTELVRSWDRARRAVPGETSILLAFRRKDVRALNEQARACRQAQGELGADHAVLTARGMRHFALGDRIYFLKNDRRLGVSNGTLGTIERLDGARLSVRLDSMRVLEVDTREYRDLDHGYAATIHKAQGITVDRAFVLASRYMDAAATYVAMTRHRKDAELLYSETEFPSFNSLLERLGRVKSEPMAVELGAFSAERLATRLSQDDAFLRLSNAGQHSALEALRMVGDQLPSTPDGTFSRLAEVEAAEREVRDLTRDVAGARRELTAFANAHPVQAKLGTSAHRAREAQLVSAELSLERAKDRMRGVLADPELRERARALSRARNRRIHAAQVQWKRLQELVHRSAVDAKVRRTVRAWNAERGGVGFRAISDAEAIRELLPVESVHAQGRELVVLAERSRSAPLVVVDAQRWSELVRHGRENATRTSQELPSERFGARPSRGSARDQ